MGIRTDVGEVPSDWGTVSLDDPNHFSFESGLWTGRGGQLRAALVMRASNFNNDGTADYEDMAQIQVETRHFPQKELISGDILIERSGGGPKQPVGRVIQFLKREPGYSFSNFTSRLRVMDKDKVDPAFLLYSLLLFHRLGGTMRMQSNTTGIRNLNFEEYKKVRLPLPLIGEQRAIVTALSRLHAAADIQQRVINSLKQLTAATMRQLFHSNSIQATTAPPPPSVRMGDVAQKISYGTSVRCEIGGGGRPVLRIPNVIGGHITTSELKFADLPEGHLERVALERGDLLFVRTNGNKAHMGRCAIYRGIPQGALFASYLLAVRLDTAVMMPDFVQAYLMAGGGAQIIANARPSADGKYNINSNTLRDVVLPCPPHKEQEKISSAFRKMTAAIDDAESKLKTINTLFGSALHDLMVGRIRVHSGGDPQWTTR